MKIILASKSPRRRELLGQLYKDFEIMSAEVDESLPTDVHPKEGVRLLAERKGNAVSRFSDNDTLVISSDTLVELDGKPLGKPADEREAKEMLMSLSGRAHNVHTGVAIHYKGRVFSGTDTTSVIFKSLTNTDIENYIKTGEAELKTQGIRWNTHNGNQPEWYDKAGSYAIQGMAGRFIERFNGEYDTVVGLSVKLTKRLIDEATKDD